MNRTRTTTWLGILALLVLVPTATADGARVLILSGQNNHAWQETTPALREILESAGNQVDVLEQPETMTSASLANFDVILSNWNNWGVSDAAPWPQAARDGLLDFVRGGKGYVAIHAGTSSFYDWPDYQELGITTWDLDTTGHGRQHAFTVTPTDTAHPITQGVASFVTFDELWHRVPVPDDAQVLATAWSSKDAGGTDRDEPILFARDFGEGRSVNLLLGHNVRAMRHPAFATLVSRAVSWAATGRVKTMTPQLTWVQTDGALALRRNDTVLWQYNFGKDARKPYFHPLNIADGTTLTWEAPPDHPWHHGLWFSWKYLNGVNYWEENRQTGQSEGATRWDAPRIDTQPDGAARIEMALHYEPNSGEVVLAEQRIIEVTAPDWLGDYTIRWSASFTAPSGEVLLDRTPIPGERDGKSWGGYAGLSVRFQPMTDPVVHTASSTIALDNPPVNLDAPALDFGGEIGGTACGVSIAAGPNNMETDTPWYVIARSDNSFYYFSPALLYRQPRTLAAGERLLLDYDIRVHAGIWEGRQVDQITKQTGHPSGDGS